MEKQYITNSSGRKVFEKSGTGVRSKVRQYITAPDGTKVYATASRPIRSDFRHYVMSKGGKKVYESSDRPLETMVACDFCKKAITEDDERVELEISSTSGKLSAYSGVELDLHEGCEAKFLARAAR